MPARPKLADPGQLIRSARPRTDTYDLCTDPDIVAEYEDLLGQIAAEAVEAAEKLNAGGRKAELQQQLDDVMARGAEKTVTLTFKALSRPKFRALKDLHPPQKNENGEIADGRSRALGVDHDPFFEALIPLSLLSPELNEETLTYLIEELLSDGQWRALTTVVWNLNEAAVSVPFSQAVSQKTQRSSRR